MQHMWFDMKIDNCFISLRNYCFIKCIKTLFQHSFYINKYKGVINSWLYTLKDIDTITSKVRENKEFLENGRSQSYVTILLLNSTQRVLEFIDIINNS